jgi:hypothetical protein
VSNKALQSTKRAKCYCDWNNPWANRKDTIYYRWEKLLYNKLLSLPDDKTRLAFYHKLMSLKLSLGDIESWSFDNLIDHNTIQNPLVDKVIYQKLQHWIWAFNNHVIWDDWLNNKQRNLEQGDFRTQWMKHYTIQQKRTIVDILHLLQKH